MNVVLWTFLVSLLLLFAPDKTKGDTYSPAFYTELQLLNASSKDYFLLHMTLVWDQVWKKITILSTHWLSVGLISLIFKDR